MPPREVTPLFELPLSHFDKCLACTWALSSLISYLRRLTFLIWARISHALTLLLSLASILLSFFEIIVISSHWAFLIKSFGGDLVLFGGDLLPFSQVFQVQVRPKRQTVLPW